MIWNEAINKAEETDNWPVNITEAEKKEYIRFQAEVYFNESNNINGGYVKFCRNAKHMIIADCLSRAN